MARQARQRPIRARAMRRSETERLKGEFLKHFAKFGNISAACRQVGIESRQTIYNWQEHDEEFAIAFNLAEVESVEVLEAEAWRRAVVGVKNERTSYWQGQVIGRDVETKYSDSLLVTLLRARAPDKYADRSKREVSGPNGGPIQYRNYAELSDDDLDAQIKSLAETEA